MAWTLAQLPDLAGKVALVTGANSGIGYHTALALARAGADLVLGCRDPARGEEAARAMRDESGGGRVEARVLDLADLASVRGFADRLLGERPVLDLLVNNAGVMAVPTRELTVDGHERQFATNHLGHFALTARLWPALLRSPAARVVTVASMVAWTARLRLDDLDSERDYSPMGTYGRAKLANLHFVRELARRARGTAVLSLAAHPGFAETRLQRHAFALAARLMAQSAAAGALPSIYAATAPGVAAGEFYGPRFFGAWGPPHRAWMPPQTRDPDVSALLWAASERMTGVPFPGAA